VLIDQSYSLDQRIKEIESEIGNKDKDIQQSEKFFADSLKTENISQ